MRGIPILLLLVALVFSCIDTGKEKRPGEKSIYLSVDKRSKTVPDSLKSISDIAAHLARPYTEPDEKTRAIHIWVSHTIRYDFSKKLEDFRYSSKEEVAEEALKTGKGVCSHYAELFDQMCRSIGIESFVIDGYTRDKNKGKIADVGHSWNAVKIAGDYYLVDNTWAAGYVRNDNYIHDFRDAYFLVEPGDFIKTHMPYDPIWQFLDNPITHDEFEQNDFSKLDIPGDYAYRDSIGAHHKSSEIDRLIRQHERIRKAGVTNNLIERKLKRTNSLIELEHFNAWVREYNEITSRLNKASKALGRAIKGNNAFIGYLNRRSAKTELEEEEMRQIITEAVNHYNSGKSILDNVVDRIARLKYRGTEPKRKNHVENETKRLQGFVLELQSNMLKLRSSLRLHALHADIHLD